MAPSRRRRSSSREVVVERTVALPVEEANELLSGFKGRLHTVKTQELKLEDGTAIIIARVKVPTPKGISGHIIRRFDTEALSASSLFRVAFPMATEEAEQAEMAYLAKRYDTRRAGDEDANGSGKLTGTWIPLEDSANVASQYGLTKFAAELIGFETPTGSSSGGVISTPTAPTPRKKSKSPAPPAPTSASRSKRARVASPPVPASSISTRSQTSTMQSLAAPFATTPSKPSSGGSSTSQGGDGNEEEETADAEPQEPVEQDSAEQQPGGIQVTQEVITDNETGQVYEETKVTFTGQDAAAITGGNGGESGLMGTDEQAREAVENARRLIESLKEDGVLQSGATKRGREVEEELEIEGAGVVNDDAEENGADEENVRPAGVFKRLFGRKPAGRKNRRVSGPNAAAAARPELGELQLMQSPDGAQVLVAHTPAPIQPNRRRFIAMAGMVVMGAATAAAPYIFN